MQICPNCGEENPPRFRLCGFCGTALAGAETPPPTEIRKVVTIVFSDLKGSTSLGEALDSESLREIMTRYFDAMRAELERHGGTIEKYIGDAIMAVFGLPTVREDDALRAVRAAHAMQVALARLNGELERSFGIRLSNRTGVNTGEVVAGDAASGQRLVIGDPVNTAARLEQAAPTDEVLLGELTYRLVREAVDVEPVEPLELKGKASRVEAYRLLGVRDVHVPVGRHTTPMVGREAELATMRAAVSEATTGPGRRMVTIIGDAGVGKSRLVSETLADLPPEVLAVNGRCLPYGQGITFWPIVEIVRRVADIEEDDSLERGRAKIHALVGDDDLAARIASASGLSDEAFSLTETFYAIRRFIETLAARGPLILLVEDIHWAEPTLLDLLEHLVATVVGPVLIVCTSRHELLEERPEWGTTPASTRLVLGPLGESEATAIVEAILGQAGLPRAIRERVIHAAEGNPLFVAQLVSMLVDDGTLRRVEGDWRMADEAGEVRVPPTIQALLAARLDRLGRDERAIVEPASVVGLVFQEAAVRHLAPGWVRATMPELLAGLDRKQLVHPSGEAIEGDESFRFHHILIRDAAYNSQLKRARSELHERFVEWADGVNADRDRALEYEEILGYHLEQAHRYLKELGPLDDHGVELGTRASGRLAAAGRRAAARGDMPAAANLLIRAAGLLPADSRARPQLLIEAGEALTSTGELGTADAAFGQAIDDARRMGDDGLRVSAEVGRRYMHYMTEGEPEAQVVEAVRSAIDVLDAAGAHRGLSRAWRILTNVDIAACRYLDAQAAAVRMVEEARLAGDRITELRALPGVVICAELGPTPVADALWIADSVLAEVTGDRKAEAIVHRAAAHLEAMRGRFDEARDLSRRSRAAFEELGSWFDSAVTSASGGAAVELLAGDVEAAESELRRDHAALAAMGEQNYISTTAAFLAEALYAQGRLDEAYGFTQESERVAAEDDVATQSLWRSVRAKILARRGEAEWAASLAHDAIRLIESAQDPDSQGHALLDLAEVHRLAGRRDSAAEAAADALARFEAKGATASATRARALLDGILAGVSSGPASWSTSGDRTR